jgi:TatA/E family protein of Tat protein translocase
MGNFGMGEMLFIGVFALLLFGPKRLPEISRSVGKAIREFKQVTNGMTHDLRSEWATISSLEPPAPAAPAASVPANAAPPPSAPAVLPADSSGAAGGSGAADVPGPAGGHAAGPPLPSVQPGVAS